MAEQELESDAFDGAILFSLDMLGQPHISLKHEQRLAVQAVYEGNDVFVCLPTGYGKSLCYQTLPFVMDHKLGLVGGSSAVLVVSPLVALMIDQVQRLRSQRVNCSIVTSSSAVPREYLASHQSLSSDSLLFCAPEALVMPKWRDVLDSNEVSGRIVAIVVDEAHCIPTW